MKQLFQKWNGLKPLVFFFDNPYSEVYLREIARRLKMSPSTLWRSINVLEKDGLIQIRREKNGTFLKPTFSNEFKMLKVAYTLSKIEEKKIVEIISKKAGGLSSILLYGSAARGEDDEKSDYDFLVIAAKCNVSSLEISEKLGRESAIQIYSISEWRDVSKKNRAFYLEVISNSIALKGEKPVID